MSTAAQLQPKQKIEMDRIEISDSAIRVASAGTCFIDIVPLNISFEDAMARYKKLLTLAREKGAKVVYRYSRSSNIKLLESAINSDLAGYQELYDFLKRRWKSKAHNIYYGFLDDEELLALDKVRNKMWSMTNRSTPIGKLIEFSRVVDEATNAVKSTNGHCTIYV